MSGPFVRHHHPAHVLGSKVVVVAGEEGYTLHTIRNINVGEARIASYDTLISSIHMFLTCTSLHHIHLGPSLSHTPFIRHMVRNARVIFPIASTPAF